MSKKDIKKLEEKKKKEEKERKKREDKLRKQGVRGLVIEGPTNVTHVSHVGWDASAGFQVRCLVYLLTHVD